MLKKISDMLEVILKRIDNLSKLDNTSTSDAKRLDELSSAISRYTKFPSTGPAPCPSYTHTRPTMASGTAYYQKVPDDLFKPPSVAYLTLSPLKLLSFPNTLTKLGAAALM